MMLWRRLVCLIVVGFTYLAWGGDGGDALVDYMERYHRLEENDVRGRTELADWCRNRRMFQQQAEVLGEVLKLEPDHPTAYGELMEADGKYSRPVDDEWARKMEKLLGEGFRLRHTPHFTILTDADEAAEMAMAEAVEECYRTFYREAGAVDLRPLPPAGRLVCILFERHVSYQDYLKRFEGQRAAWTAGHYSWRTNRAAFFDDQDNPVFKEVRQKIAQTRARIEQLRAEFAKTTDTAKKMTIQEQIKKLNASYADMSGRLAIASRQATLEKTRHEATHQLLFNSGLQVRGRDYPFWLNEGLATCFEVCDADGRAGPRFANQHRLKSYRDAERTGRLIPLEQLLRYQPGEREAIASVAEKYGQAWVLMHFLWNTRKGELRVFLNELTERNGADQMGHFRSRFGDDLPELEAQLRRFIDGF